MIFPLRRLGGIQPPAHANSVNASWFESVNFTLITFRLAVADGQAEAKSRIKAMIILWDDDFTLDFKVSHFLLTDDPNITFGK